jgi:hypothetical protein
MDLSNRHSMYGAPTSGEGGPKPIGRVAPKVLVSCAIATVLAIALGMLDLLPAGVLPDPWRPCPAEDTRFPLAVLGDSDSQGYQDTVWYPPGTLLRGGDHHAITLQWTEILARLRADQVDPGDVRVIGGRRRVVRIMELLGFERRAPRKGDHAFNFAFGGAHCRDLNEGTCCQVPRLLDVMGREPERWRRGAVIIRIGIVDLGGASILEWMARTPDDPALLARIDGCVEHVARAVRDIRAAHPETAIVLVGILDNVDHPPQLEHWRDADQLARINRCLDRYDRALEVLADSEPRIAFFDDRAWFRAQWGGRDAAGQPAYKTVRVGDSIEVSHSSGDEPTSSVLADGHAGVVWNALWAQSISETLRPYVALNSLETEEIAEFLRGQYTPWR